MKDVVVLAADKDMEQALKGLLSRPQALGIRLPSFDLFAHPRHDPGCLNEAHNFLRSFIQSYNHALVVFDHQGCGQERISPQELAVEARKRLSRSGWDEQAEVIVLAPELEVWVWSSSPYVEACLGWSGHHPSLHEWLTETGHRRPGALKPDRPKEAMEAALRQVRRPRSSSIYLELAQKVSLSGHSEPAFLRLVGALQRWFPQ